jgi:hypothetical protein
MKATPEIDSKPLTRADKITHSPAGTAVIADASYRPNRGATHVSAPEPRRLPELKNFRALSRNFFGAETSREYIAEAILFGWIMLVAAWPLSVTLNQLGTMMISPPPGGIW